MCALVDFQNQKRCEAGRFEDKPKTKFRVWGNADGERFDRTFPSARAWRAWRNLQRVEIDVLGMQSVPA